MKRNQRDGAIPKSRVWKKVDQSIYTVGPMKIVFFRAMVNGRRTMVRAPIQGAAALYPNGKPTNELKKACLSWKYALLNQDYYEEHAGKKSKVPSFNKLLDLYESAAYAERLKSGTPEPRTIETAIKYFKYLVEGCGYHLAEPCTKLRTQDIDAYMVKVIRDGVTPTTAYSYAASCKSVTARWSLSHYANAGYEVQPYKMPIVKNRRPPRYERPSQETIDAVEAWHDSLWRENGMSARECRVWFFSTMMLRFAVRNGDVGRLTPRNFAQRDGEVRLCYTPHKTANRSGARVCWPLSAEMARRVAKVAKMLDIDEDVAFINSPRSVAILVNEELRKFPELDEREKASYELRKMCVDKIFHKFGVELASAISGDDIRTLACFYSDPERVNEDSLRAAQMAAQV